MNKTIPTHIVACAGIVINENDEILLVDHNRYGWVFPGGQVENGENLINALKREILEESGVEVEVGEVFCITSNTRKHPGYRGVDEVPTQVVFDFVCKARAGLPRPSDENAESIYVSKEKVLHMLKKPIYIERFKAYMDYNGRPTYIECETTPVHQTKLKRLV